MRERKSLRLLSLVRMLGASVHEQVTELLGTQLVALQHAAYCVLNNPGRVLGFLVAQVDALLSAGVARVGDVDFVSQLLAGYPQVVGIDDDDVVATIRVGREGGLVLATQHVGNLAAQPAQSGVGGINHNPALVGVGFVDGNRLEAQMVHWGGDKRLKMKKKPQALGAKRTQSYRLSANIQAGSSIIV